MTRTRSALRAWARRHQTPRRPGIAALLALVVLIPMLGMAVLASSTVSARVSDLNATAAIRTHAVTLSNLMLARVAVTDELVPSSALAASAGARIGPSRLSHLLGINYAGMLASGRAQLNTVEGFLKTYPDLEADLRSVEALRPQIDAGRASVATVDATFGRFAADIDRHWQGQLILVRSLAETSALGLGPVDRQLSVLEATFAAFVAGTNIMGLARNVLIGQDAMADTKALLQSEGSYASDAAEFAGQLGPKAATGWRRVGSDPATKRFAAAISDAVAARLNGAKPHGEAAPDSYAPILSNGAKWIADLTLVAEGATTDLRSLVTQENLAAVRALILQVSAAAFIAGLTLATTILAAHAVGRPVRRLSAAAREIGEGRFTLPSLPDAGPRDLVETARAVNDMAATLSLLEAYAVALTDDLDSPLLDEPMPGRIGQALQVTLDRLRASLDQAKRDRVVLQDVAAHDSLTRLLNRGAGLDAMNRELHRSRRDGTTMMALFIDLDGLKEINDTCGHDAGDDAIRLTAEALRAATRQSDIVARIGGDEFLISGLIPESRAEAECLAQRVRQTVGKQVVYRDGRQITLSCSIGVALVQPEDTVESLITKADKALYLAKQDGRNRVAWWPSEASLSRPPARPRPVEVPM